MIKRLLKGYIIARLLRAVMGGNRRGPGQQRRM